MELNLTTAELTHILNALNREEYHVMDDPKSCALTEDGHSDLKEYLESARESEWPVTNTIPTVDDLVTNKLWGLLDKNRKPYLLRLIPDEYLFIVDEIEPDDTDSDGWEEGLEFKELEELQAWWDEVNKG